MNQGNHSVAGSRVAGSNGPGLTSVAVIGASGIVGSELISLLDEEQVAIDQLRLFGSSDSVGEFYSLGSQEVEIQEFEPMLLKGIDVVVLAMPGMLARDFVPAIAEHGCCIIDLTAAYRLDEGVELVAPLLGVQGAYRAGAHFSVASASAMQIVAVARAITRVSALSHIVATSLQSVSDAGRGGLDELWSQSLAIFNQKGIETEVFGEQIAYNCIPQIGEVYPDGESSEERLIAGEVKRLLNRADLPVQVTAIRVPVFHGSGVSLSVVCDGPIVIDEIVAILQQETGLEVSSEGDLPMHLSVVGQDRIHVGRIRLGGASENGVSTWTVVDNVRAVGARGALSIIQDYVRSKKG